MRRGTLDNGGRQSLGGEELLNKVAIIVFFVHKKYSRRFIKLLLNHWCHMDNFTDVLTTFFGSGNISVALLSMEGQKALGFRQKYLEGVIWRDFMFSFPFGVLQAVHA